MKAITPLLYAFIGWILCGAMIGIGRNITTIENALIIHLLGAPIVFAALTKLYYKKKNTLSPLQLALYMLSFVIVMDVLVVSLMKEKSFDMFKSPIGTWIPFVLIFISVLYGGKRNIETQQSAAGVWRH